MANIKDSFAAHMLISRKHAAQMLDVNVSTMQRMERARKIVAIRPMGPRGKVFYVEQSLHSLVAEMVAASKAASDALEEE